MQAPMTTHGVFTIDTDASAIRFTTKAVFGLATVTGSFRIASGRVTVGARPGDVDVHAVVAAASVDTGNAMRDHHLRSGDYLDVGTHPEFEFTSSTVNLDGGSWSMDGSLVVHDVSRPAALTGDVIVDGDRITAAATTTVDRYAFGLTHGRGMTGRHLDLTMHVVAERLR